jgi:hypothetical protein
MNVSVQEVGGQAPTNLTAIAAEANAAHRECVSAAAVSFKHALISGHALTRAKAQCRHGEWEAWLRANFEGSIRTAQAYMRLFAHRKEIQAKSAGQPALMTIEGAIALITDKRPAKPGECLPADLDAEHAFRSAAFNESGSPACLVELIPSAEHPSANGQPHDYVFVSVIEFDADGRAQQIWSRRPIRCGAELEILIPEHLRPLVRSAGWEAFPKDEYSSVFDALETRTAA